MEDELSFLLPAILDGNFKKAQIFCNSRHLCDLVGKNNYSKKETEKNMHYLASWLTKKLKHLGCDKEVAKLNGENSNMEKERVTRLFKAG